MKQTIPRWTLALGLVLAACSDHDEAHDHSTDHPSGHDHHEQGHGHGDMPMRSLTLWSDQFELFAEHPAAEVGAKVSFLIHLTDLSDFQPVEGARLVLELTGPASLRGETAQAVQPGIYRVVVTPTAAGDYTGQLQVTRDGAASGSIRGIVLRVHAAGTVEPEPDDDDDHNVIEFLKEQQWRVPFATQFAKDGSVVATVQVSGRVSTPPTGTAEVGAPVPGRLAEPKGGLLPPGSQIRKGQLLASLIPAPSSPELASQSALAVAEANARLSAADKALERARRLIQDEAISKRALEDAEREQRVARESVQAAQRASAIYRGGSRASWPLRAPKAGTLVTVKATPGASVQQGQTLFRIVDTSKLWIVAKVPERDAARLRTDRNVSYRIAGLETWHVIDIDGDDKSGSLVMVSKTVDRRSRTVEVIYALDTPNPVLRVDGLVQLELPAGPDFSGVVVPRTSLVDREGSRVVYVQVDGEHFEERAVRVGPRAGGVVGIDKGLEAGERIVTSGAHLVRLADRADSTQAHGHVH